MRRKRLWGLEFLDCQFFADLSDHEQFYDCGTIILYDICITKFVNPSSAGDFACSAGELEIECESWRLGIYAHCFPHHVLKEEKAIQYVDKLWGILKSLKWLGIYNATYHFCSGERTWTTQHYGDTAH